MRPALISVGVICGLAMFGIAIGTDSGLLAGHVDELRDAASSGVDAVVGLVISLVTAYAARAKGGLGGSQSAAAGAPVSATPPSTSTSPGMYSPPTREGDAP